MTQKVIRVRVGICDQAEDGRRDGERSRGLGEVYKRLFFFQQKTAYEM